MDRPFSSILAAVLLFDFGAPVYFWCMYAYENPIRQMENEFEASESDFAMCK